MRVGSYVHVCLCFLTGELQQGSDYGGGQQRHQGGDDEGQGSSGCVSVCLSVCLSIKALKLGEFIFSVLRACVCACAHVCVRVRMCVCTYNVFVTRLCDNLCAQIGSKVVVKQQDGTLAPGTVVRLTDASWYTVGELGSTHIHTHTHIQFIL